MVNCAIIVYSDFSIAVASYAVSSLWLVDRTNAN